MKILKSCVWPRSGTTGKSKFPEPAGIQENLCNVKTTSPVVSQTARVTKDKPYYDLHLRA